MRARLGTRAGDLGVCGGLVLVALLGWAQADAQQGAAPAQQGAAQRDAARSAPPAVPTAADGSIPKLRLTRRSLDALDTQPKLAQEVNAGVISREQLRSELARGIGRFLRDVRTEPAFSRGRFVGWRVLELFVKRPEIRVQVLRPGDTVLRINGRSVERPEDFKQIWDGLANASELTLDIARDGNPSKLRYTITP